MKSKVICIGIAAVLLVSMTGCNAVEKDKRIEKIVLAEDVTKDNESNSEISVERIDLELENDEYFDPAFYLKGELYGSIQRNVEIFPNEPTEEYPLEGYMKKYLYKLEGDDKLSETSKEIFTSIMRGSKITNYRYINGRGAGIYTVDYSIEDIPRTASDMSSKIDELVTMIYEVQGSDVYYYCDSRDNEKDSYDYLYIYDEVNARMYKKEIEYEDKFSIFYMAEMDSLMAWDINTDIIYKVKLIDKSIEFEKLVDIRELDKEDIGLIHVLNENEIILEYRSPVSGTESSETFYKTDKVSKYNFNTNEYKILYESPKDKNIDIAYLGNGILAGDEFEVFEDKAVYKYRYTMKLEEAEVKVILKENIEEENDLENQRRQWETGAISEDGKEIFIAKHILDKNDKLVDVLYKRYLIKEK